MAVMFTGQYTLLINAGAGVEGLIYAISAWLVVSLRKREPDRARPFRAIGVPWVTLAVGAAFLVLGVGALSTTVSGVPGALIFVAVLVVLASAYVYIVVPHLGTEVPVNARTKAAPEETIE
jgi:amino acid transporter